jgi:hypothetical protein
MAWIISKSANEEVFCKKRSIFFTLSYWKDNLLYHNLDVMYMEKNVVDNIIDTLLDMKMKLKDNHDALQDLWKMDLRLELHPFNVENNHTYLSTTCFTITKAEKYGFLNVISDVRVSNGYASNVSHCVSLRNVVSGIGKVMTTTYSCNNSCQLHFEDPYHIRLLGL